MPEAEITIQYVNFPKEGKKRGSIKSSEGKFYWAGADLLRRFTKGEVCVIEYASTPRDDGGEWLTLKRKVSTSAMAPSPAFRNRTDPAEQKQIFVTALLKEFVASGKVEASRTAVVTAGNALKGAYDDLFGSAAKQTTEAQLDDEMPDFDQ